jgi:hypothetical protein
MAPGGVTSSFPAVATVFLPATTGMSAAYYQYQADVTGLQAGVAYQYQVVLGGQIVASDPAQYTFRTPTAGNFSFLVLGDSGNDSAEQTSLVQLMKAYHMMCLLLVLCVLVFV